MYKCDKCGGIDPDWGFGHKQSSDIESDWYCSKCIIEILEIIGNE